MENLFLICAIFGSTVIVLQFVLMLLGFGHEGVHGHDLGGHDFDGGGGHDIGHHHGGHDGNTIDTDTDQDIVHHQSFSNWLFGLLSVRSVITFMAFFGLAGMAARSAEWTNLQTIVVAIAAGGAAAVFMNQMFRAIFRLRADGTVRIDHAVGLPATVYLGIPGEGRGWGKIQLMLQNRTMEYEASTTAQPLPTGTQVVVTRIVGPDRVEVQAAG